MDEVSERLLKWFNGSKAPPEMVQIYPTNKCNLECIFCTQRLNTYKLEEEVSKKRFLEITRELCEMGVKKFLISGGGEPFCRPSLTLKMMEIIKEYDREGRIITNGTLFESKMIRRTIEIGWDVVVFSLDGSRPSTHDFLRSKEGCFEKIIHNISNFNKIRDRMKSRLPVLEFTTVLNTHNYKEVPELVKLGDELKIRSMNVEPICVNNPTAKKIKLNKKKREKFFGKILPKAERTAKKLGIRNNFQALKKVRVIEKAGELRKIILKSTSKDIFRLPCYEPWLWPKIEANGEVWPCSTIQMKTNIKKSSFKDIWYGKEFENFRNRVLNRDLPEDCKNCVLTHIPRNREIKRRLMELVVKNERKNK